MLTLTLHEDGGLHIAAVPVHTLVIAGWTGRDAAKVQAHIDELAAIGVKPPANVPVSRFRGPADHSAGDRGYRRCQQR